MKINIIFYLFVIVTYKMGQSEGHDNVGFRILANSSSLQNHTDDLAGRKPGINGTGQSYTPRDIIFNSCEMSQYTSPKIFRDVFPYYQSGFDDEGRPIWVGEFGQYNLRRISSGTKELINSFDHFLDDVSYQLLKSLFASSVPGRPVFEFIFIVDFEHFDRHQMTLGNLNLLIKLARRYTQLIQEYAKEIDVINVNFLAQQVTTIFRPILGGLFEKVKIFGTNQDKWAPYLRNNYPLEAIPSWYGGSKDFKPVQVFGR